MEAKYRVKESTLAECMVDSEDFLRRHEVFYKLKKKDFREGINDVMIRDLMESPDMAFVGKQLTSLFGFYDAIYQTNSSIDEVVELGRKPKEKADAVYLNHLYSLKAAVETCVRSFRDYAEGTHKTISIDKYVPSKALSVHGGENAQLRNRKQILEIYGQLFTSSENTDDVFQKTYRLFEHLNSSVKAQFEQVEQSLAKEYFTQHHIGVQDTDIVGIEGFERKDVKFHYATLDYDKSIGNEVPAGVLKGAINFLSFYHPEIQTNILVKNDARAKPKTILLRGPPGTGKSDLCNIAAANAKKIADKKGMRFKYISLSNAVKTKWYGESGANIRAMLNDALDPSTLSIIVADDVDMVVSNREDSSNGADNEILHEFMTWLDGAGKEKYKGQFIVVMNSNHSERLDSAIKNRCTHNTEVLGPTTKDQYIQLMKMELGDYSSDFVKMNEREWGKLGSLCEDIVEKRKNFKLNGTERTLQNILGETTLTMEDIRLSGRDVNKICDAAKSYIQKTDELDTLPEEILSMPADRQEVELRKHFRQIDFKKLESIIISRYEGTIKERLKEARERVRQVEERVFFERMGHLRGEMKYQAHVLREGASADKVKEDEIMKMINANNTRLMQEEYLLIKTKLEIGVKNGKR